MQEIRHPVTKSRSATDRRVVRRLSLSSLESVHGTITVYSGRTIAIQEIEIDGEPTDTKVEKASHKIYW